MVYLMAFFFGFWGKLERGAEASGFENKLESLYPPTLEVIEPKPDSYAPENTIVFSGTVKPYEHVEKIVVFCDGVEMSSWKPSGEQWQAQVYIKKGVHDVVVRAFTDSGISSNAVSLKLYVKVLPSGVSFKEDELEDNDFSAQAVFCTLPFERESLALGSGDEDWFAFEVQPGDRLDVNVGDVQFLVRGDLEVDLFNQDGDLVGVLFSYGDDRVGSFYFRVGGKFYLCLNTTGFLYYSLSIKTTSSGHDEENDVPSNSVHIVDYGVYVSLDSVDEDWFCFTHPKTQVEVAVAFESAEGDIDAYVYDENFHLVAYSTGYGSYASCVLPPGKVHYVKVVATEGSPDYVLTYFPTEQPFLQWSLTFSSSIKEGIAFVRGDSWAEGFAYVGDSSGVVHKIDIFSGSEISSYSLSVINQFVSVVKYNRVFSYGGSHGTGVYAVDEDLSSVIWYAGADKVRDPAWACVAADGKVAASSMYNAKGVVLDAFSSGDASQIWEYAPGNAMVPYGPPSWGDGVVVFTFANSTDSLVKAFYMDNGTEIWEFHPAGEVFDAPLITDGKVYFASRWNKVYALDLKTGALLWEKEIPGEVHAGLAYWNGLLFFPLVDTWGKGVVCVRASDGATLWHSVLSDNVFVSPVSAGGLVFAATDDGYLYCLNAYTGRELWKINVGSQITVPPAVYESYILVGDSSGRLSAYYLGFGNITSSPGEPTSSTLGLLGSSDFYGDDRFEDNDEISSAAWIDAGSVGLICKDDDWFKVYLETGRSYRFLLSTWSSSDVEFSLYDSGGTKLCDSASQGDSERVIDFAPSSSGYYYLKVSATSGPFFYSFYFWRK